MKYASECIKSELDIFDKPPIDTSNEVGYWSYHNVSNINLQNELTIEIPKSESYLDLSSFLLYVKLKIYKDNVLENLDTNCGIAPVNNFLHSLFSKVQLIIDSKEIENTSSNYAFKSYILNLLNHGHEEKNSFLTSSLFYKDDAGQFVNFKHDANAMEMDSNKQETKPTSSYQPDQKKVIKRL